MGRKTPRETPLEIEVKFLTQAPADVRRRLQAAGAGQKQARQHEYNLVLDTPDATLHAHDCLLRLREDDGITLTYKGAAQEDAESEAKVREELEVTVSDWDTAVAIFKRLGYAPVQVYEKYRETFMLDDVEVVLDEMPYGNFVELEGSEAAIKEAADILNLSWQERLVTNYLALMARTVDYYDLDFTDLTFENFEGLDISLADVLEQEQ